MTLKNKRLLEVLEKDVAIIPTNDGWIFKFNYKTLKELVSEASDSPEGVAFVFVKHPPLN